ncbi:hypothetical protein ABPG72_018252 [Tetrahymena utriculariae]
MAKQSEEFNIKYKKYEEDKYNKQILDLYLSNFLTTAKVQGYVLLFCPVKRHGILKVLAFFIASLLSFASLTSSFLSFFNAIIVYIAFVHLLVFYIIPKEMEKEAWKFLKSSFVEAIYPKMKEYYTVEKNRLYLAIREDTDEVIGMTSYEDSMHFEVPNQIPSQGVSLTRVSVSDKYKGRGIASKLSKLIEQEAKSNGKKFIALTAISTNKPAQGLYKKNGYTYLKIKDPNESFLMKVSGIGRVFMYKLL